jgi:four helix bundle protein
MSGSQGESKGELREQFKPRTKEIRDHRDLRVWRKARRLAGLCGEAIASFPEAQKNLANVIRRLADEVPDEIAAGQSQGHHAAYMDHLERARRALHHLERRLIDAHKTNCLPSAVGDPLLARLAEIDRMLGKLMVSLELADARRRVNRSGR